MQRLEWSPELWIRDSNLDQGPVSSEGTLTFSDIVKIVNQTIMETDKIVPTVGNLADRQRFIEAKRNLVNAAARFVTSGKSFNANPTSANHKQVEDADRILHACHNQLTLLIKQHLGVGPTESQSKKKERLLAQMIQSARTLTAWQHRLGEVRTYIETFDQVFADCVTAIAGVIQDLIPLQFQLELLLKVEELTHLGGDLITNDLLNSAIDPNILSERWQMFWDSLKAVLAHTTRILKQT
eukprot:TRINITY_DN4821_c0_g1_i1.p1 TRINITY_DN4821_c0_g1~~TRINITY_DN4821_c0_g1_i1.p1  ORF type:complete len:240 (-),score=17.10 TRINITY_DN4821_c0_g1_i1:120-839(-)